MNHMPFEYPPPFPEITSLEEFEQATYFPKSKGFESYAQYLASKYNWTTAA